MPGRLLAFLFALTTLVSTGTAQPPTTVNQGPPLPIWAWHGVPSDQATPERYKELAEAGFTLSFNGAPDAKTTIAMLGAAHSAGVKLLISMPELQSNPEETARQFKDHPALGGYYLRDEPSAALYAELGEWTRRIQSVDNEHPCYVNLLPTYGNPGMWGTPDYDSYVKKYLEQVPTPMLSFDHYPVIRTGADAASDRVRPDFYHNLEICSQAAREAKRPLGAFVLAVAHTPYPIPTIAHLRLQAYSDLAYGAQVIQYFTYWTPVSTVWNFHEAPISADGKRTATYDVVKQMNAELQAVRGVFVGSEVESIGHTGVAIPAGTMPYQPAVPVKSLTTEGTGVVASVLKKENQRFLVLVNRDIHNTTTATIEFDGATAVAKVDKQGALHPVPNSNVSTAIEPGDVAIYAWLAD